MNLERFLRPVFVCLLVLTASISVAEEIPAPVSPPPATPAPATPAPAEKDKAAPAAPAPAPAPTAPAGQAAPDGQMPPAPPTPPVPGPNPPPPPPPPAAEDDIRVDAEIYYSDKDPRWEKDVKPLVEDIEKNYSKMIRMHRISIDTPEGEKKLAEAEKDHLIAARGEVTFIFGPYSLVSKGDKREVELYMEPMIVRLLNPEAAKGRLPVNVADYTREIFGKTATAEPLSPPEKDQHIVFHKVTADGKPAGWVVDAFNPIKCPICGDVQFLMAVAPDFKTVDVRPVRQLERRGRKLEDAEVAKFMGQFKRELPRTEPLKVDGISGATRTTLAYEQAMNEIIKTLMKAAEK